MNIQRRILTFITRANWILLFLAGGVGLMAASREFALGIISGGLLVTVNFHLLARTLRKALTPPHLASHQSVVAKYYVRFMISGLIIFLLVSQNVVNPIGLFIGLSVVVASIMLATLLEIKHIFFKEAM